MRKFTIEFLCGLSESRDIVALFYDGTYVYATTTSNGLVAYDFSNKHTISYITETGGVPNKPAQGLIKVGDYIYTCTGGAGLLAGNINKYTFDGSSFTLVKTVTYNAVLPGNPYIGFDGTYLYIISFDVVDDKFRDKTAAYDLNLDYKAFYVHNTDSGYVPILCVGGYIYLGLWGPISNTSYITIMSFNGSTFTRHGASYDASHNPYVDLVSNSSGYIVATSDVGYVDTFKISGNTLSYDYSERWIPSGVFNFLRAASCGNNSLFSSLYKLRLFTADGSSYDIEGEGSHTDFSTGNLKAIYSTTEFIFTHVNNLLKVWKVYIPSQKCTVKFMNAGI